MVIVNAVNQRMVLPTDKKALKAGARYELYMVRQTRYGGIWFTSVLFLACVVFLAYALLAGSGRLWIYATAATAVTAFIFVLTSYLSISQVYDRISLLASFGSALSCQNCLLVISKDKKTDEAWFASGLAAFKDGDDMKVFVTGDFYRCELLAKVRGGAKRINRQFVSATRCRSFVQTDSLDLRDHLAASAIKNREMLLKKAGFRRSNG